ncbi:MAG: calycin-like domain-containing protein [Bacteroidaceae bacterium]|nr:calycin-like domain-containing protein [Bacteroidaceae bacterium]
MKRTLLLLASFCLCGLSMQAQEARTYTEDIIVTVNNQSAPPQPANIDVLFHEKEQTIDLTLKNFCLSDGENTMGIGNIAVKDIPVQKDTEGRFTFNIEQTIKITEGEGDSPSGIWLGPELPEIPLVLQGELDEKKIYATIDIDLQEQLGQIVYVVVGTPFPQKGDAIRSIVSTRNGKCQIVDLAGRRVSGSKKGLYIVNGKKVAVR